MEGIFVQLAIILFTAFVVSYIIRALNQPIIIGYIIAGIIISPFLFKTGASTEIINIFSEFGISFLLFIVGLHLNPKVIREIGISSLIVGLVQIATTFGATYAVARYLLGFSNIAALYIGIGLALSSTIIIMKLLSDKKQLDSLYGKISIGVLIIQDLVAVGVLMFVASVANDTKHTGSLGLMGILSGVLVIAALFFVGFFILPKMMKNIAKSQEMLFLFSICWCFVLAALFTYIGFSMEIGSLVAGVILSVSPYATEISSKIRPLRDFFLIIFFIILGLKVQLNSILGILFNAIILSGIALILKPVILMTTMKYFGFTKRTNFLTGTTLGQISEFSLILVGLGITFGQIGPEVMNTMVLTMIITILLSSYMIIYSSQFYNLLSPVLNIFQKKDIKREIKLDKKYDAILFGYNRIGFSILKSLKRLKRKYLVIDFNPETITNLKKYGVPALYGDVYDLEFLEELPIEDIKLAISTIPEVEINQLLIDVVREVNKDCVLILRAHTIEDALKLYKAGANYVLTPHFLGGEYVAKMIKHSKSSDEDYADERTSHIKMLKEILSQGHDHPEVERN
ncbi:MAG: cation:proton antiporter [Nanoarchaeota archaeon]|jgi:Kef-type K+ transport system membrane component KefB/Trk K+ transport system NAD-binding subunit|nr:cation:proton antiporter [Nanoarchaeota archaeon]